MLFKNCAYIFKGLACVYILFRIIVTVLVAGHRNLAFENWKSGGRNRGNWFLRHQLQAFCAVSYKRFASSVTSVLRRQLQAFCAALYKRFAPTVTSVLRPQLQAFYVVSYKRFAQTVTSVLRHPLQAFCAVSYKHFALSVTSDKQVV